MKPITEQERQALIEYGTLFNTTGQQGKMNRLIEIALASLAANPEMYSNRIEICDSYGPEIENRVYPDLLSAMKSKDDHGGVIVGLFTAPPVPVIKFPDDHKIDGVGSLSYATGYEDGHQEAIEKIKRLNGIK